jgi:putative ABC transport system substrate-binding protein
VASAAELGETYKGILREKASALIVPNHSIFLAERMQIADFGIKNRLPVMYPQFEAVRAGCLISYGASIADVWRRSASYVDRILKGARPADLPVEQPTKFHLAVNTRTAKAIGLTIPQELLLRADEVIE